MTEHSCEHSWCIAGGAMCTCPYSDQRPHRAADCDRPRGGLRIINILAGVPEGQEGAR